MSGQVSLSLTLTQPLVISRVSTRTFLHTELQLVLSTRKKHKSSKSLKGFAVMELFSYVWWGILFCHCSHLVEAVMCETYKH